jgi:hypothetical protein
VDWPKDIQVSNLKEVPVAREVRVSNMKEMPMMDMSKMAECATLLKEIKADLPKVTLPTDAKNAIAVRLSDGEKFYKALDQIVQFAAGGGGGYKEVNATLRETIPTDDTKTNGSMTLSYTGTNLTTVVKTIKGVTYTKTLTYDGSDNLIGVSAWS